MAKLLDKIKAHKADVFRRAYFKRRDASTGLFENTWQEVSKDVKKWGSIKYSLDKDRLNKFSLANTSLVLKNDEGFYNEFSESNSFWFNHADYIRTLVKFEAGFVHHTLSSSGIWSNSELPGNALWDEALWDEDPYVWDGVSSAFVGILWGDASYNDKNEVRFNIAPLTQVFRDFPARNLTGWDSSLTASRFVEMLRDQTDGSGSFLFRPFFGDTTTFWDIQTTTTIYADLNTSTAKNVIDKNCWEVVEKLSEVEGFVPYITKNGEFSFKPRSLSSTTSTYNFYGINSSKRDYGHTIKTISKFGRNFSKHYSRLQFKWKEESTSTSYEIRESPLEVTGSNVPWIYGQKTLNIENLWIPTTTVAEAVADSLFTEYSAIKHEMNMVTSFVPDLDIFNLVKITYDANPSNQENLWGVNNWADSLGSTDEMDLVWDPSKGTGVLLYEEEYRLLSLEIDLNNFQNRMTLREV